MKRKLSILRVLLSQKPLWILDEPVLGLDQNAIGLFEQACRSHLEKGGSIVFCSHGDSFFSKGNAQKINLLPERGPSG